MRFFRTERQQFNLYGCCVFAAVFSSGCGGTSQPAELKNLAEVKGTILFQGQPPEGAVVMLHPSDGGTIKPPRSSGIVDPDGNFAVQTSVNNFMKPGAAPGEYRVTVSWPAPAPTPADGDATKEQLPAKYQDPAASGLIVNIAPGENELDPMDLKP